MSTLEVKKAQNNLTCPVCYQLFKNPKYLPCYHSYCEECLEKMLVQSKITCPECDKEAIVPAGGVKEFAANLLINQLVDNLTLTSGISGKEKVKCYTCDNEPVISFCPECNIFQCYVCNDHHRSNKTYHGHNVVPLTELRSGKDASFIPAKMKTPLCQEHQCDLKHYCETCDVLVCMYCTVKKHNGHDHDTVKKMASKHRSQLKKVATPIEGMIQDLSDVHNNVDKMMKKITQQGDEMNKQINQHYDELVKDLMKQRDKVKQQVYYTVSQKEKALTTQLDEVDSTQAELVSMKELNDTLQKSSDQEALSSKKQIIDGMHQLTEKYNDLNKRPVQSDTMEFIPSKDFPQLGKFFACAEYDYLEVDNLAKSGEVPIITKDSNEDDCSERNDKTAKSFTGKVTVEEVKDIDDGIYVVSHRGDQIEDAACMSTQEIREGPIIASCRNYRAVNLPNKVVNNSGRMGQPWGIAYGSYGVWAVADRTNHCVYVFDGQDQLVLKFGKSGDKDGQFGSYSPRGITFDNDNHLYVADSGNNRIQKFDINGNYLLQFGCRGSGEGQIKCPYGIATHINGRVYVADKGNRRISVFQSDGQFCVFFGSGQLGSPYDVAVTGNNQLLVADHSHKCIVTFTLDGHYVGRFDTQGPHSCQINSPCSLATDMNGFILVTNFNHSVSVYDHAGSLVHCFGTHGSAGGEFNDPYGIAVSPNGSIYVSDFNNKRVQIFGIA